MADRSGLTDIFPHAGQGNASPGARHLSASGYSAAPGRARRGAEHFRASGGDPDRVLPDRARPEAAFPHADGGESEFVLSRQEDVPHGIGKAVRVEKTPQPDVRIEQQPHLLDDFPLRKLHRGGDEVTTDLAVVLHRAEPSPCGTRRRWQNLGDRLAEASHQNRLARLPHPVENGQTGRLEFRNPDLFHGQNVPRSEPMVPLRFLDVARRQPRTPCGYRVVTNRKRRESPLRRCHAHGTHPARTPTGRTGRRRAARPDAPAPSRASRAWPDARRWTVTSRASRASGASSVSTWDSTPAIPAPSAAPALSAMLALGIGRVGDAGEVQQDEGELKGPPAWRSGVAFACEASREGGGHGAIRDTKAHWDSEPGGVAGRRSLPARSPAPTLRAECVATSSGLDSGWFGRDRCPPALRRDPRRRFNPRSCPRADPRASPAGRSPRDKKSSEVPVGRPHPAEQTFVGQRMAGPRADEIQPESTDKRVANFGGFGRDASCHIHMAINCFDSWRCRQTYRAASIA